MGSMDHMVTFIQLSDLIPHPLPLIPFTLRDQASCMCQTQPHSGISFMLFLLPEPSSHRSESLLPHFIPMPPPERFPDHHLV